jgi:long-chain acyl-CoA synthetase
MNRTFISLEQKLFELAESNPEKIAIIHNETSVTYKTLTEKIKLYSFIIQHVLKIKNQDVVLLIADRSTSFIATYFALHLSNIIAVIIDPEVAELRFNSIKEQVNPKLLLGFHSKHFFYEKIVNLDEISIDKNLFEASMENFNHKAYPSKDDFADLIFTTGTTGFPKGVFLTHENIVASANNINTFIQNRFEDIELIALPLNHSFGLGRVRCVLSTGGTIVLCKGFSNIKRIFTLIEKYSVTGLAFVPSAILYVLKISGDKLSKFSNQIRYIELGSAPMLTENKIQLCSLLPNTRICMHYGLTEASRSTFLEFSKDVNILETIGKPSPNVEICIMDEHGKQQPLEVQGEICIKGLHVAKNYLGFSKQEINLFFWNDFLRTGDNGILKSDGFIKLVGRKSDIINVGGKKLHPSEVEDVLNSIEHIEESVCVGVSDPQNILGEVVRAYLIGKPDLVDIENVKKIISSKLESYKCPVDYKWIDNLPKTDSGKLKRADLKNI